MKEPIVGEWQVDENTGERYRMVGQHCKEYEKILIIDGFSVPESQLEEFHKQRKKAEEEHRRRMLAESHIPTYNCPFETGLHTECKRDRCAVYMDGCLLRNNLSSPAKDTKGLLCPFSNLSCRTDCTFYSNGCMFTGQIQQGVNNNE